MKIDDWTKKVLTNFAIINNNITFNPGDIIRTCNAGVTILAEAKINNFFTKSCGISALPKLLNMLALYKDTEIEFNDRQLVVTSPDEPAQKLTYSYTNPEYLTKVPEIDLRPKTILSSFELSASNISRISKGLSIFDQQYISISGKDSKLKLSTVNAVNNVEDGFSIVFSESYDGPEFNVVFEKANFLLLSLDYDIKIGKKLIWFSSTTPDKKIDYFIPFLAKFTTIKE